MKWEDFCALGEDISKNGLKYPIDLLKGVIIDGRHRYLACIMFKVKPKFEILPEDTEPLQHVKTKNFHRRHLTNGQKYNLALELYKEEKIKAKKRQQKTQFAGKDANNRPIKKSSVGTPLDTTEKNGRKGKALVLAAKDSETDPKTLSKIVKIAEVAKKNKKIQEDLDDICEDKKTVEEVYRKIEPKNLNRRKDCNFFRAAACPRCYERLMACKLELKASGNLLIKKECPDPCLEFKND